MRAVFEDARDTKKEIGTHYGVPVVTVHTARAVYCQLGEIRKNFVRPSKSDVSNNPSGKLVREFAIRDLALSSKQAFVLNLAKCSELVRYAQGAYAHSLAESCPASRREYS